MLAIQAGSAPHLLQERLEALSTVKPKAGKQKREPESVEGVQ